MINLVYSNIIRYANNNDFDWVSNIIEKALKSFYNSNHLSRARQIFNTCVGQDKDIFGDASVGQCLAVAEEQDRRVGLVYLVEKKSTIKISLLVVQEASCGNGVGRNLLGYVEQYAFDRGIRKLYCKIATTNAKGLQFLIRNGFSVVGTAQKRHRRQIVKQSMLFKQLDDNACAV